MQVAFKAPQRSAVVSRSSRRLSVRVAAMVNVEQVQLARKELKQLIAEKHCE